MSPAHGPAVVVVGSGVAGAATAFSLSRARAAVTVVDSEEAGAATPAGAGIVQPWASAVEGPFYDLYAAGAAHYPELVRQLAASGAPPTGYTVCGSLVVDDEPERLDAVEARVQARTAEVPVAGEVTRLSPAQARALFPPLASGLAALHVAGGARVDGRRLRAALLEAARARGVRLVRAEARLEPRRDGGAVVVAGASALPSDAVVVAAGAWTDRLLAPLGYGVGIEPQRGQITHLALAGAATDGWPSVLPPGGHYLVAFEGERVVVGATRETGSGPDPRVTAAGALEVLTRALAVAPGLAGATVLETRVGLRPATRHGLPVIGPVPDRPGLFLAGGFGAAGLTMGPAVGHALAELVLTGRSEVDLAPFTPEAAR